MTLVKSFFDEHHKKDVPRGAEMEFLRTDLCLRIYSIDILPNKRLRSNTGTQIVLNFS